MIPFRIAPLVLAVVLLSAGCERSATIVPRDEADLAWLQANAIPLRTAAADGNHADMMPLKAVVGSARMVGLGEATHGTREFFTMKHRMLEFLVKEMGFTTFGIEATYAEALAINAWVHGGPGDPEVLLSNLHFWTWNTDEVLEMMPWMRRHNENPGAAPRVSFYGFDMQYARVAMDVAEAFARRMDPAAGDSVAALYACYRAYQDEVGRARPNYAAAPADVHSTCRAGVRGAHALLEARRGADAPADPYGYETALRAARVVVQNEHSRAPDGDAQLRDLYMAENSRWLLERPGAEGKVVLWAHNAHMWNVPGWQGSHLRSALGDDYLIVGFAFHSGSFTAIDGDAGGLRTHTVPDPPPASYERELHRLGQPIFAVDLRPLRVNPPPGAGWMLGPRSHWSIGSLFRASAPYQFRMPTRLADDYDVVIHVDRTTNSRARPFRFE